MTTTIRTDIARHDWDRDGSFESTVTTQFNFTGDKLTHKVVWDDRTDGTSTAFLNTYGHDDAGRVVMEHEYADQNRDGTWETDFGTLNRSYDDTGRVSNEMHLSPDFDGDGVAGDYTTVTAFGYDADGHLVTKNADSYTYGEQAPADYRDESWAYDSAGRLTTYMIDDPMAFDNIITHQYRYNKQGLLQDHKVIDEYTYGDEQPHYRESFTYQKNGEMKTSTLWSTFTDKGWFLRTDTAYAFKPGYDSQKVTYDLQGDWDPEAVKLVENWYNADRHLTHTLISHDPEGDGGPLPGGGDTSGYDYRDLIVQTWNGGEMIARTEDLGADGVIDHEFSSSWLIA